MSLESLNWCISIFKRKVLDELLYWLIRCCIMLEGQCVCLVMLGMLGCLWSLLGIPVWVKSLPGTVYSLFL